MPPRCGDLRAKEMASDASDSSCVVMSSMETGLIAQTLDDKPDVGAYLSYNGNRRLVQPPCAGFVSPARVRLCRPQTSRQRTYPTSRSGREALPSPSKPRRRRRPSRDIQRKFPFHHLHYPCRRGQNLDLSPICPFVPCGSPARRAFTTMTN